MARRLVRMIRDLVEAALPWYDPKRDAARDRRTAVVADQADRAADSLRDSFARADERMANRRR